MQLLLFTTLIRKWQKLTQVPNVKVELIYKDRILFDTQYGLHNKMNLVFFMLSLGIFLELDILKNFSYKIKQMFIKSILVFTFLHSIKILKNFFFLLIKQERCFKLLHFIIDLYLCASYVTVDFKFYHLIL